MFGSADPFRHAVVTQRDVGQCELLLQKCHFSRSAQHHIPDEPIGKRKECSVDAQRQRSVC
jgi:hypothetical protein